MVKPEFLLEEDRQKELVALYRLNFTDQDVSDYFGIRMRALKNFLKRRDNAPLRDRIKKARVVARLAVRQKLFQKAAPAEGKGDSDFKAIQYWLQNNDEGWREIVTHEVSGRDGKPLEFQPHEMTKGQLVNYVVQAIQDGLLEHPSLKIDPPIRTNGLDPTKAVDAEFSEESRESD